LGTAAKGALDGSTGTATTCAEVLAAYTESRFFGTLILAVSLADVVSAVRTPSLESNHQPKMMKPVPAQDLRLRLGEYLDRADISGDAFVVTRGERPKAVLLGVTQYLEMLDRLEALEEGRVVPARAIAFDDRGVVTKEQLKAMLR
jgi:prevent-host-death family protein